MVQYKKVEMLYSFFANTLAGLHTALIVYFLVGWLVPFASLRIRAFSSALIGGVFAFFYLFPVCPLTLWEYKLRHLAGENVDNRFLLDRLGHSLGFDLNPFFLSILSLLIISTISIISLVLLAKSIIKPRSES
jgi:hypothetical protein